MFEALELSMVHTNFNEKCKYWIRMRGAKGRLGI